MKPFGKTENIFNEFAVDYDKWYDAHSEIYQAECKAIERHLPPEKKGLEVGVGTGRFASKLKAKFGIDIAFNPLKIASSRGVLCTLAMAENLPFKDEAFDFVLLITTLCFLKKPLEAIKEVARVLKHKGKIIVGIVNRESTLGKEYERKKKTSPFYKEAHFYAPSEVVELLKKADFKNFSFTQTLEGGFVVIAGEKG